MVSSYQKTARDTVFVAVATLVQFILGIFRLPILTKTLGAHDYGLWSQVDATVNLLLPLTGLGLIIALVRFLAAEKDREAIREGFYSILLSVFITSAVVSALVLIFASPLAMHFFDGNVLVVRIAAAIVLVSSLEPVYLNLMRTFQQIKKYTIFIIAESCVGFGLIAILVLNGYGILGVILSFLAVKLVFVIILFFMTKAQTSIKMPNFSRMKEFLALSLPTIPRRVAFSLVNISDRYVISFFLGITSVGIYSVAYALANIPYSLVAVLTFVLLAPLSKFYDEGRMEELTTHLSYSLKYFLAIAIPFIFGAAVLAEPVLRLFSTPEIASKGRFIVPVVALAVTLLSVSNIITSILFLVKKTKIQALIWIVAAVLNLGLNILVVPRIGIMGAAITTLLAYALALGLSVYFSFREFRFSIDRRLIGKSLIASVVMSLVVWLMAPQGHSYTLLTVVTGVVVYGVVLIALRGFSRGELGFFFGLFRRDPSANDAGNQDDTY